MLAIVILAARRLEVFKWGLIFLLLCPKSILFSVIRSFTQLSAV